MVRTDRSAGIKERIRTEASRLFADQGFALTGVRDIAAAADVDPALVIRHFGSKESLFVQTITLPDRWHEIMASPVEDLATRLLRLIFAPGTSMSRGAGAFSAMVRASDREEVRRKLRDALNEVIAAPLAAKLTGHTASARAHLFSAAVVGLLTSAWIIEDETVTELGEDVLTSIYGPALQSILTGSSGSTPSAVATTS